jgi:TonB family protein
MSPILAASPAMRLAAALAASAALHAGAAYVAEVLPRGSPSGGGAAVAATSVQLRILGADAPASAPPTSVVAELSARPALPEPTAVAAVAPQAGTPFGLREEPRYYPPSQLDTRPYLLTRVEPIYPQGAPPDGGQAVLRLLIGEDGKVERAVVVSSEPVDKFGEAAAAAFGDAQFSAGKLNGVAVKSQLLIEMKFSALQPPGTTSAAKVTSD